ncbi:MAG: serine/threonine-protein kinase [Myxococcota bacterium]
MQLQPGAVVTPTIRLKQKLGEGAMGSIWSADDTARQRQIAVKFVAANLADENLQAYDRFEREAFVLDGVRHPNIVEFLERGRTADGTPYIALEWMRGRPLVDYIESDGVLTMEEMGRLVQQLGAALQVLHDHGIIHRDVKAENVFVDGQEASLMVKLFDFGLAKKPDDAVASKKQLTGLGMMVGTAEYMSPEQVISSRDVDHYADLWAMGVVSYVSLVGGLPFAGGDLGETITALRSGAFERPSTIRDDVPPSVDTWFERSFHLDRKQRFPTATMAISAWMQAAAGHPQTSAPALVSGGPMAAPAAASPTPAMAPPPAPPVAVYPAGGPPAPAPPAVELASPAPSKAPIIAALVVLVAAVIGVLAYVL